MARVAGLGPESEALAKQALLILLFAREPLRTEDLAYALSIEPDSEAIDDENVPDIEDVAGVCAGLIIIDRESNIVRLVHKSAQEYFERNQAQLFPRASETMARLCLKYHALATSTAGFDKNIEASWPPFWRYAYINWGYHSRCAEKDKEVVKERDDKAETDRTVSNLHSVSTLAIDLLARDMAGSLDSALHEACREGRHALVELLLSVNDYDLNQPSTGASETCQNEHRVPTSGGSPNSDEDSWSEDGMTSEIEQEGDKGNSSKLAGHESDTESAGIYNHTPHVISGKRRHGPHSDKISVLLSRKRRFVADKDWKYLFTDDPEDEWTAAWIREQNLGKEFFLLIVAAENGDHTMIRILLNHGADANVVSNLGETALYIAARKGDQTTVSILLDQPAIKPDCKCWVGERSQRGEGGDVRPVWWTPLLAAAHHDRPECVRLLLDYSQRDYRDEFGRNAACVAAAAGHTEVLKELLQWSDVDVDPPAGVQGISALEMALRCEHEEAALVLIPHSDANRVGPDGDRPLNLAARARSCEAIRLLFARAAQVNARGNQGRTVLHTATMSTCKDTIGLILTHPDIDINIRDNHGYTPLMILVVTLAGMRFHRKIYQMALGSVNLLLSRPELDINARNFQGPTALGLAVSLSGFWEERNDLFDILSNHPDVDRDLIFEAMQYRWTSYASKMNREI
jgi:ankyrin repeat protein